jgi:predicted nucleotidyltransferase
MQVSKQQLNTLRDILNMHFDDAKFYLFGSRVKNQARDNSDLDLAILAPEKIDFKTMALLEEDLTESDLPFIVEIHDYQRFSPQFISMIKKNLREF